MNCGEGIRHDDQAATGLTSQRGQRAFDVGGVANARCDRFNRQGPSNWLSKGLKKNDPPPGAVRGLNTTATRTMAGTNSLSIPSHLPVRDGWKLVKPVALPPGRAMLVTKPLPKGSETPTNTIGTVRVSRRRAAVEGVELPTRTSGRKATSSFAKCWA